MSQRVKANQISHFEIQMKISIVIIQDPFKLYSA